MADSPAALAYQEAVRRITEQRSRLDSVRTRAATLLSAASIVTSFLGAEALKDPTSKPGVGSAADRTLQCAELIAIGAFVGVCIVCLWILLPKRKGWTFGFKPAKLIKDYVDRPASSDDTSDLKQVQRNLALWLGKYHDQNEPALELRFTLLQVGALLIGIEVVAWIVDLT